MEMQPVESSSIAAIGHDSETGTLAIRYKSSDQVYHSEKPVSADEVAKLRAAKSIGAFFPKMGVKLVKAPKLNGHGIRKLAVILTLGLAGLASRAQYLSLTGTIQAANGLPGANLTMSFTPTQTFFLPSTGVVVATTTFCATSIDGTTHGLGDALSGPILSTTGSGSLAPATYYVQVAFYDATGNVTLASPQVAQILSTTGSLVVSPPASGLPAGASGMRVYISTTSGAGTLQGSTTGTAAYTRSTALTSGAALPAANTTICKQIANDAGWPVGTGYKVGLVDRYGNALPNFPMTWQLNGAGSSYDLSTGFPYYHGVVIYPTPILAVPQNHLLQSISGPLSLGAYSFTAGAGSFSGNVDAATLTIGGAAPNGWVLVGDGFHYVASPSVPAGSISGIKYQTVQNAGAALAQQPILNFTGPLVASADTGRTNVTLGTAGTPGTCTNPSSITTDTFGRVVSYICGSGSGVAITQSDMTGSRALSTTYQNTTGHVITVDGWLVTTAGGADGNVECTNGATSGMGQSPFKDQITASDVGGNKAFHFSVPATWYYACTAGGTASPTLSGGKWYETTWQ